MACFLWAAPDSVAQGGERSKRGRALAHEAASLQDSDPERLERGIRIFKGGWESKRQTVYARWARAEWTKCQWWVEQKKEEADAGVSGTGGETGNLGKATTPGTVMTAFGDG
jgi:hypothetical protein